MHNRGCNQQSYLVDISRKSPPCEENITKARKGQAMDKEVTNLLKAILKECQQMRVLLTDSDEPKKEKKSLLQQAIEENLRAKGEL